jgi:serine protease inhibitor
MRYIWAWALAGLAGLGAALAPAAEPARAEKAEANPAATANNDFAFDLYKRLAASEADKPLFFSPYSISTALAIVAEGARGETADEMGKVLRFPAGLRRPGERPWDVGPLHAGLAALSKQFEAANKPAPKPILDKLATLREELAQANEAVRTKGDRKARLEARRLAKEINALQDQIDRYEVRVANALWAEKTYPFKQSYLDTISKYYGTQGAYPVDFKREPDAVRKRINAWVEKQTRDKIKDLIPPGAIDPLTRLVVTNAIYFKGAWLAPFHKAQTKDRPFTLKGGKKLDVPTMHGYPKGARYAAFEKDGSFFDTPLRMERGTTDFSKFYPGADGFEALELPYKGGELSMVVLAPRSPDGLPALEKMLSGANLQAWAGKLNRRPVDVYLPKLKMDASFDLGEVLKALGMKRAFIIPGGPKGAQFDGMSDSDSPADKLYVWKVLHKAFVEVNEKGTEAAAATAVILKTKKAKKPVETVPFTPTFKADRPFVFLIRDQRSGTVLFLGRVLNPKKGA